MENEFLVERLSLSRERLAGILKEQEAEEALIPFFRGKAAFLLAELQGTGEGTGEETEEKTEALKTEAERLGAWTGDTGSSPVQLPEEHDLGNLLQVLHRELLTAPVLVREERGEELCALLEVFLEIYQISCQKRGGEIPEGEEIPAVRNALYYYFSDYADVTLPGRLKELFDPAPGLAEKVLREAEKTGFSRPEALEGYGVRIGVRERERQERIAALSEEEVRERAEELIRRIAGETGKPNLRIVYPIGAERLVHALAEGWREKGGEVILCRRACSWIHLSGTEEMQEGFGPEDKETEDEKLRLLIPFWDAEMKERKLGVLRSCAEEWKEEAGKLAGVICLFPERREKTEEALSGKQGRLLREYREKEGQILLELTGKICRLDTDWEE